MRGQYVEERIIVFSTKPSFCGSSYLFRCRQTICFGAWQCAENFHLPLWLSQGDITLLSKLGAGHYYFSAPSDTLVKVCWFPLHHIANSFSIFIYGGSCKAIIQILIQPHYYNWIIITTINILILYFAYHFSISPRKSRSQLFRLLDCSFLHTFITFSVLLDVFIFTCSMLILSFFGSFNMAVLDVLNRDKGPSLEALITRSMCVPPVKGVTNML